VGRPSSGTVDRTNARRHSIARKRPTVRGVIVYACFALFIFWILFPLWFTAMSSIMTERELASVPPHWLPQQPTLKNYGAVLFGTVQGAFVSQTATGIGSAVVRALGMSFLIGMVVALFNVVVGGITAYGYSRFSFPGRNVGFFVVMASRVVPAIAIVLPFFILFRNLDLIGSPLALIISYNVFTLPLAIWVISGYLDGLPRELEDSARVEGAKELQVLFHVVAPLALPGLIAAGLLVFLECWSEFFYALVLTNELTIPPVLVGFQNGDQFTWTSLSAATMLSLIPPMVLALVFQRYVVSGLTKGAFR
jgi:ABC-type glycerol-3-phosphate transport system permease component